MIDDLTQYFLFRLVIVTIGFFTAVELIGNYIVKATKSEIAPPKNDLERNLRIFGIFDRNIDRRIILKNIAIRGIVFFAVAAAFMPAMKWVLGS